jgi:hypothetical protein
MFFAATYDIHIQAHHYRQDAAAHAAPFTPRVITAADIALDAIVVAPNIAVAVFTVIGHCF